MILRFDLKLFQTLFAKLMIQGFVIRAMKKIINKHTVNEGGLADALDQHRFRITSWREALLAKEGCQKCLESSRCLFESIDSAFKLENLASRAWNALRQIAEDVPSVEAAIGEGLSDVTLKNIPTLRCSQGQKSSIFSTV